VPVSAHDKEMSAGSLVEFYEAVKTIHDKWHREDEQRQIAAVRSFASDDLVPWKSNASWPLKPSLYRLKDPDQNEICSGFKRRALQLMSEPHLPQTE